MVDPQWRWHAFLELLQVLKECEFREVLRNHESFELGPADPSVRADHFELLLTSNLHGLLQQLCLVNVRITRVTGAFYRVNIDETTHRDMEDELA
jgi:hypothetical protein